MKKSDWLLLLFVLSTFVIGIIFYPNMPDKIPIHWNIKGQVDNYGNKFFGTFMIPGLNLALFFLFLILPKVDPRKENYKNFNNSYTIFRWTMHIFLSILFILILINSLKTAYELPRYFQIQFVVSLFVAILFIIIGNYLGKIRDNFFIGIRTPWTLSSKEVWYKTHRLAGKLYVISGVIGVIGSFFGGMISFILLLVPIFLSSIYSVIYSYFAFQKEKNKK